MAPSPKYDNVQVCNENVENDEYHLDDLLDEHDNLSDILKYPPKRVSKNVHTLISHRVLLQSSIPISI